MSATKRVRRPKPQLGAPVRVPVGTRRTTVYLDPETIATVRSVGGGSLSQGIRVLAGRADLVE